MSRERNYLAQYLNLIDDETNEQLGYIGDISDQGLMFITTHSIPPNIIKSVRIENNVNSKEMELFSIQSLIKTLWQKPNINPKLWCIGCSII